jgi:hypothetical protein
MPLTEKLNRYIFPIFPFHIRKETGSMAQVVEKCKALGQSLITEKEGKEERKQEVREERRKQGKGRKRKEGNQKG